MQNISNKYILKYGLIAVVLIFIISLIVFMQFSLDDAVFLKHYYDLEINYNTYMNIHVITNSNDTRRINEIEFPQMPDDFVFTDMFNIINSYYITEKFAHYNYNILSLELPSINLNQNDNKEEIVILDKAIVKFNNGDEQEVNIGKIVLHKNSKHTGSLKLTSTSSSNDYTSTTEFISNDNFFYK
jgi:hypothetical protein